MKSSWLRPGIYAILDTGRLGWTTPARFERAFPTLIAYGSAAAAAGACALQLRTKSLRPGHELRTAAYEALRSRVSKYLPVFVDDDVETARFEGDWPDCGLHLGQNDMPPWEARVLLGEEARIGWSTHNLEQVLAAAKLPVDYLGFGPVRATTSKRKADDVTGFDALREAVAAARQPVVAIGGLQLEDMAAVRQTGARAAAVIGAWLGPQRTPFAPDEAGRALASLRRAWEDAL